MSTKATLFRGKGVHLYQDLADDESMVYLEMDGPPRTVLGIPIVIWERVRHHTIPNLFDCAALTDEEIEHIVKTDVAERIAAHRDGWCFKAFAGTMAYGAPSDPVDEQVSRGIAGYKAERARQRALRDEIARL